MRRKDRAQDREFALELIDNARYCVISMIDAQGMPYSIPMSIVRRDEALFFHAALTGKKSEAFAKNPNVCVTFVGRVAIPEITEQELEEIREDRAKAGMLIRKVFTTEYESVILYGDVEQVVNDDEKKQALRGICMKYTPTKIDLFDRAIEASLSRTTIYKINIGEITAKSKSFEPPMGAGDGVK